MMERLDKYIASRSSYSRKDVKTMIRHGKIRINGKTAEDPAQSVTDSDALEIGGALFHAPKHVYIMLHKPKGVVSVSRDIQEKTVVDLIPTSWKRDGLFPAGRLDKDTTGFVLITDDGDFAHRILSPKKHVDKTYLVTLRDDALPAYRKAFEDGILLSDGTKCMAAELYFTDDQRVVRVVLREGRYHQIKRMFAALQNSVEQLHREAIGNVSLDADLKPGDCRMLTEDEVKRIESHSTP